MHFQLLFKIKNAPTFSKVISQVDNSTSLFTFETSHPLEYDHRTILTDEDCYKIDCFSGKKYFLQLIEQKYAGAQYAQWDKTHLDIHFSLCTDGQLYYFQKFSKSRIIKHKWINIKGEPTLQDSDIIVLPNTADALYDKSSDTLFFNKLDHIKSIFPGIDTLFKEATNDEINMFLNHPLFNAKNYNKNKLTITNRKKIASYLERLKTIKEADEKSTFCEGLLNYNKEIHIQNNTIDITSEKDLTSVLNHLDERYYTTQRSNEKRLANSVISI